MSAKVLLNRRDNYLKYCSKDVTEEDIHRLRDASFTPNEVFIVDRSDVQKNFIQLCHVLHECMVLYEESVVSVCDAV